MFYVGNTLWLEMGDSLPNNFSGIARIQDGRISWYKKGLLHRPAEEGPAQIWPSGYLYWWEEGKILKQQTPKGEIICFT